MSLTLSKTPWQIPVTSWGHFGMSEKSYYNYYITICYALSMGAKRQSRDYFPVSWKAAVELVVFPHCIAFPGQSGPAWRVSMERQAVRKNLAGKPSRVGRATRAGGDQVQSLVRALALLNRIAESSDDGATLTDLAQQVGLPASTAHRLPTTLEQERYVRFTQDGRFWSVGVQAFVVG
ncbi:MAG TPA: helix-turn-helix domain-containing protein, partial [Xanthobacteraceae bacterium]|nr:helix-turn-helix domain-containing protein [Xanthobacteraceae bacterium]